MRLIGREKLLPLKEQGSRVKTWLTVWTAEVTQAHWTNSGDLLREFPKARDMGDDIFQFNVGDEDIAVNVLISFTHSTALIISPTHITP